MTNTITRRDFIKIGAAGTALSVLTGCMSPRPAALEPYVTAPEDQLAGQATWFATTCRQCPAGCGTIVRVMNGRALMIAGNPQHPLNQGKLCPRGHAPLQVLYNPDRLASPVQQAQRGSRQFTPLNWDDAIKTLSGKLGGAGANIAVWTGTTISGHLYDLFKRFTGAVGAPDPLVFDSYTSLTGYHSLRAASQTLLGRAALPTYDLSHADVVYSFNTDFTGAWISQTRLNIEFGGLRGQPLGKRGILVQFEPRMSQTGVKADRWIPLRPGTEALVAQAIARLIADFGPSDKAQRARALTGTVDVNAAAEACGIPVEDLRHLADVFASADRAVAIPGASLGGTDVSNDAVTAVQALNLIAGNFGRPGGLSLSPDSPDPALAAPVASTYADAMNLISRMQNGQVQALLVYGVNPVYEFPRTPIASAIAKVPFVATFASIVDETSVAADLILPERSELESWGYAVVQPAYGAPVVGSQQPVVTPVRDARATADVLLAAAKAIPAARALTWNDEVAFLKETLGKLSSFGTGGTVEARLVKFQQAGFWQSSTPPATAAPAAASAPVKAPVAAFQGDPQQFPFFLHIYVSDLLSDGRGAAIPWLQGSPDPTTTIAWQTWLDIHPKTATNLGLHEGDIVQVTSPFGQVEAVLYTYPGIREDTVALPTGQGHTDYGRYASNRGSNPLALVGAAPAGTNLAWGNVRVAIKPTGAKKAVAKFENTTGSREGFSNADMPGS